MWIRPCEIFVIHGEDYKETLTFQILSKHWWKSDQLTFDTSHMTVGKENAWHLL
jgi:hypothetical protein